MPLVQALSSGTSIIVPHWLLTHDAASRVPCHARWSSQTGGAP